MLKYLLLCVVIVACNQKEQDEFKVLQAAEKSKQDSIQLVLNSIKQREIAQKNLVSNISKLCQLQLLELENGQREDSLRLAEFTDEMKVLYPQADRQAMRRVAMNIESCEEYRVKALKERKKSKKN